MNQPEQQLARKIVRHLDAGLSRLDADTAAKLLAARKVALARYQEQRAPAGIWVRAGNAAARLTERPAHGLRYVIGAAALTLALVGLTYWHSGRSQAPEVAEIDAGILTDELPINAYLDKGFDSWLKRSSR